MNKLVAFYVHYHGNSADLWIQLHPDQDFMCWSLEYATSCLCDLKECNPKEITIKDLPDEITNNFDFNRHRDRVREIYQLF